MSENNGEYKEKTLRNLRYFRYILFGGGGEEKRKKVLDILK